MEQRKGIAGLQGIPMSALLLGIAVIVVALMITVMAGLATSECTRIGGTEGAYTTSATVSPVTQSYIGCCSNVNASAKTQCLTWANSVGLNTTAKGISGLGTFNDFWSVLVLIVILSIVIVALYAVFPRSAGM